MFEFNPKLLLFIPATVIFYKLLSQKEEVNEEEPYDYFKYQNAFQKSLTLNRNFEKPRLPNRRLKSRKKLFKIMDDSIKNREVKEILNNIITVVVNEEIRRQKEEKKEIIRQAEEKEKEKKEKEKNVSYLSYFNISRFISRNNDEIKFEKVDLSSDGSYDKVSDISKISEFSKISKISEFSKIDEEIK